MCDGSELFAGEEGSSYDKANLHKLCLVSFEEPISSKGNVIVATTLAQNPNSIWSETRNVFCKYPRYAAMLIYYMFGINSDT